MSSLLQHLPLSRAAKGAAPERDSGVSVLAAVVDGLAVSPTGLSVLHGRSDTLLPGLWQRADATTPRPRRGGRNSIYNSTTDVEAAITVELPPMRVADESSSATSATSSSSSSSYPLQVTVPLANTVFQNGRRSTLLASRWSWTPRDDGHDEDGVYTLMCQPRKERECQIVVPSGGSDSWTSVPLLAATEPRKIAAGLGNIVRQVVLDGKPSPASHELEAAIPVLLATRRSAWPGADSDAVVVANRVGSPLGVWGLVIPPAALSLYARLRETLAPIADHSAEAEQCAAAVAAPSLAALLAGGCRLHRICTCLLSSSPSMFPVFFVQHNNY